MGVDNPAGIIVLAVFSGLYRFWVLSQWAIFIWEARGVEGRPNGNTLGNTPRIYTMLGHLLIQAISTFGLVLACALVGAPIEGWNIRPILRLAILSVSCLSFQTSLADRPDHFSRVFFSRHSYGDVDDNKPKRRRHKNVV